MPWLHAFMDVPAEQRAGALDFWSQALGWPSGVPWDQHPEFVSFVPPDGRAYVHLQQIGGPPRLHLDVESDDVGRTAGEAVALGAEKVGVHERWMTLRSPGGLPFCVVPTGEPRAPGPVTWPDGHRSRMVQVCIDSPTSAHEAEVAFWRGFLPGRWAGSDSPEFEGKWHDDAGSPVQLLFQRLEEPAGIVRAHLDLGTDDLEAEVSRLLRLGAADVGRGHGGWWVLRDRAGSVFCVTSNSPELMQRRDLG